MRPAVSAFALSGEALACTTPEGAYANCLALSVRYALWLRDTLALYGASNAVVAPGYHDPRVADATPIRPRAAGRR